MKEFTEVVKLKIIPTTFVYRCAICGFETTNNDRHFGLIKINEHMISNHAKEVNFLDNETLYSRKKDVSLENF
jgi:predicted restriction endonuclease